MNISRVLPVFILALAVVHADAAATRLTSCIPKPQPIKVFAPTFPPRLHNEFVGTITVAFRLENGVVQEPWILRRELRPVGNARGEPFGYDEAVLSAVSKWRYSRSISSCHTNTEIRIEWTDK